MQSFAIDCSSHRRCCFAGKENELAFSSLKNQLCVWQLPVGDAHGQHTIESSPILELKDHESGICSISFNKNISTLASTSIDGIIKLWMPNQQGNLH